MAIGIGTSPRIGASRRRACRLASRRAFLDDTLICKTDRAQNWALRVRRRARLTACLVALRRRAVANGHCGEIVARRGAQAALVRHQLAVAVILAALIFILRQTAFSHRLTVNEPAAANASIGRRRDIGAPLSWLASVLLVVLSAVTPATGCKPYQQDSQAGARARVCQGLHERADIARHMPASCAHQPDACVRWISRARCANTLGCGSLEHPGRSHGWGRGMSVL